MNQEKVVRTELACAPDHLEDREDNLYDTKSKTNHIPNPLGGRERIAILLSLAVLGSAVVVIQSIPLVRGSSLSVTILEVLLRHSVFVE